MRRVEMMIREAVVLACVCLTPAAVWAQTAQLAPSTRPASSRPAGTQPARPQIEVVFVLDTTGSMGGLIQAAKDKIWAIANTLATSKPAPVIRMGLVGYRDRGDEYVTRRVELTDDLDAVYGKLMSFQAQAGGDGPESVNQALDEAVTAMHWSSDEHTYRVIFLVGDFPPHMDYQDDVKYPVTCEKAAKAGITINCIQCGQESTTEPAWRDIAKKSEGRFFRVEQSGSAVLVSTPFDNTLAELSRQADETKVFYGAADVVARQQDRDKAAKAMYAKASSSALAQRGAYNAALAGRDNFLGGQELLNDVETGQVKLDELSVEQLPDNMKKMSAADRDKYTRDQIARRKDLQARIRDTAAKRQAFIEEQVRKVAASQPSLDGALFGCIKDQAAKRHINYDGGPTY